MYKIFHGFHLVEAYQDLKKAKRLAKSQTAARCIKLTVAIVTSLILWLLPIETFGIDGLTVIEQRLISIFIFATLMWVFEAIPMDYFRADCCLTTAYRIGQQPVAFHTRDSGSRPGADSQIQIHHALFCRPYHNVVHRWFYTCHRSN